MKLVKTYFFIAVASVAFCTLQGCGKKASPHATCKADTFPPAYDM